MCSPYLVAKNNSNDNGDGTMIDSASNDTCQIFKPILSNGDGTLRQGKSAFLNYGFFVC